MGLLFFNMDIYTLNTSHTQCRTFGHYMKEENDTLSSFKDNHYFFLTFYSLVFWITPRIAQSLCLVLRAGFQQYLFSWGSNQGCLHVKYVLSFLYYLSGLPQIYCFLLFLFFLAHRTFVCFLVLVEVHTLLSSGLTPDYIQRSCLAGIEEHIEKKYLVYFYTEESMLCLIQITLFESYPRAAIITHNSWVHFLVESFSLLFLLSWFLDKTQ